MFSEADRASLKLLFGKPQPPKPDPETLRKQLADVGETLGGWVIDAARAPNEERLESLAIALQGIARLAGALRAAMIAEGSTNEC